MQIPPLIAQTCDQIGDLFDDLSSAPTAPTPADIERWIEKAKRAEQTADRAQVAAMYVMSMFKNGPDSKNTKRLKSSLKESDRTVGSYAHAIRRDNDCNT